MRDKGGVERVRGRAWVRGGVRHSNHSGLSFSSSPPITAGLAHSSWKAPPISYPTLSINLGPHLLS